MPTLNWNQFQTNKLFRDKISLAGKLLNSTPDLNLKIHNLFIHFNLKYLKIFKDNSILSSTFKLRKIVFDQQLVYHLSLIINQFTRLTLSRIIFNVSNIAKSSGKSP